MELKYNLQHQVVANTAAIANLTTQAADIESDIDSIETNISGLSERVADTETDIIDLNARTLKRSVTATEPKIVSLASDGSQANLALGTNLSIENNVLNAAGGGGSSGLYLHHVILYTTFDSYTPAAAVFDVVCDVSTAITNLNQIINHCVTFGNLGPNWESAGGYSRGFNPDGDERSWGFCIFGKANDTVSDINMYAYNEGGGNFYGKDSYTLGPVGSGQTNTYTITDTVIPL